MNDQSLPPDPPEAVKLYRHLPSSMRAQSLMLIGLFTLLVFYTLYFAQDVLVPIFIAILFNLLLSPLVLRLRRLRLPYYAAAAVVVVGLVGALGGAGYALSGPAVEWVHRAPQSLRDIEKKVRSLKKPMQEVSQATKQVEQMAAVDPQAGSQPKVTVQQSSLPKMLAVSVSTLLTQTVIVIVLLYFLLASGDLFMRRFVKALSSGQEKRRAVEIARQMQKDVSLYLATVTMINGGLGIATGLAMWGLGMPSPVLWGVVAGLLNFIPYLGAMTTITILAVVGLLSFDSLGYGLLPAGVFFLLTNIEANLVTPYMLGRQLTLNPAIVFLALVLWGWLWGIAGALLAVPLLVTFKIFADHIESLSGVSIFLGRREE